MRGGRLDGAMGMLDELAIDGAERIERSLGKRAALRALAPLLDSMPEGAARARARLEVLRLAAGVDPVRFGIRCVAWETERHGEHRAVRRVVRALLKEGERASAVALARAEVARVRETRAEAPASYLLGLALEAAHEAGAREAYDHAAARAAGRPRLESRARVRALLATADPGERARRAEALLPLASAPPEHRLAVAVAALGSSGRYRRAAALDVLEELVRAGGPVGEHALARAALHAESAASSAIERDRVRAILVQGGASPEALAALDALARMAAGAAGAARDEAGLRARAVLDGLAPGPRPREGRLLVEWLALAIVHAAREGRAAEVRELLREAHFRIAGGARVEAPLWTAVLVGAPFAREPARTLVRALCARADAEPPPRGHLVLADAWLATGASEEGVALLRRAAAAREPGARARLALYLRSAGWTAAREGRRDEAIRLLREAKRLAR
ncbi:MAG: hypothetical protein KF729_27945 [Sandaracinaceae bacterium]|nr:hypothetical protein [Sandaracinaceae bacterium]